MTIIKDKNFYLIISKDSEILKLKSETMIGDGKWHKILFRYNAAAAEIIVDDIERITSYFNESKITIDLDEGFNFGFSPHVKSLPIAPHFHGCVKNMKFNNEPTGFPNITVSNGLAVNCSWSYPCFENFPCLPSSRCSQYNFEDFICNCDQAFCMRSDYALPYKLFNPDHNLELVQISPMKVPEGETIYLSDEFIRVSFESHNQLYNSSNIVFSVVHQPKHGKLIRLHSPNIGEVIESKNFTLLDLKTNKIAYVHDGSETLNDHCFIDLQVLHDKKFQSKYLKRKLRFVIHFDIVPVNDSPTLQIEERILTVVQNVPKQLNTDFIKVKDPDSPAKSLVFSIVELEDQKSISQYGRFLVNARPVNIFTAEELQEGKVQYIYNTLDLNETIFEINLQVSDGIEASYPVPIRIQVYPLELKLINNTGIIMVHKSSIIITNQNLAFATNSDEGDSEIKYSIVKSPQFGLIERFRNVDGLWTATDSFTRNQLFMNHIRYTHMKDSPFQDEFKLTASCGSITSKIFDFRITFTRLRIIQKDRKELAINGTRDEVITNEVLSFDTTPILTTPRNIIYQIKKETMYGKIYFNNTKYAKEMDSFTQQDIDKKLLTYQTHRKSYSSFIDYLEFAVMVSECDIVFGKLKIIFNPLKEDMNMLTYQNKMIFTVNEGEAAPIETYHFDLAFDRFYELCYSLTILPKHGWLLRYDDFEGKEVPTNNFTLHDLGESRILYQHDDTESEIDQFELLIMSPIQEDFQYVSKINVKIDLVNDNSPQRELNIPFYVVRNTQKLVKKRNLNYFDNDSNSSPQTIMFTHVSCLNGEFLMDGKKVNKFSQEDINEKRIYFQHLGPDIGTASFIVTDGIHEVAGTLDIKASDPYVMVLPNNASIVQEGKFILLNTLNFNIETNVNVESAEIIFNIIGPPMYGLLTFLKNKSNNLMEHKMNKSHSAENFTLHDLEQNQLIYWNTESSPMDKIRYKVIVGDIFAEGEVIIKIFPAVFWEPLKVENNKTIYVEESTSKLITKDNLQITHPNISPNDITYIIKSSPLYGYLEVQAMALEDEYNIKVFDQAAINSEKVYYIQAGVNQSKDFFVFDVTNGITWLKDLQMEIIIIPDHFYVKTVPLEVVEGKIMELTPNNFVPIAEYYKSKILEYKIVEQPKFGSILVGKFKVNRFTQKQLDSLSVFYAHDGGDEVFDSISFMAVVKNKESHIFQLNVTITPVNDERPYIAINNGIAVWQGGKCIIKNTDILAKDKDSPSDELVYVVEYILGGYLINKLDKFSKIHSFTQYEIDSNEIVFIHDNISTHAMISFILTDGTFNTTKTELNATIQPIYITTVINKKMQIFPHTKSAITKENLYYICSDGEREVTYMLTSYPKYGNIIYFDAENNILKNVTEFMQDDIHNNFIYYENTIFLSELQAEDSFSFSAVIEPFIEISNQKFDIELSVSAGGLLKFLNIVPVKVTEGEFSAIDLNFTNMSKYLQNKGGINNAVLYAKCKSQPLHGTVKYLGSSKRNPNTFYADDFLKKNVIYEHDHSDTIDDLIDMTVFLEERNLLLCNITIPVEIAPVNDRPFTLITKHPQISLVEGENATITKTILYTEDSDTPPEEIIYEIISGPKYGYLFKENCKSTSTHPMHHIKYFTQEEINDECIHYAHSGSAESTSFYFKVSDGKFLPIFEIFNINIEPIYFRETNESYRIILPQGVFTAFLEIPDISFKTNVKKSRLLYNVTNSPEHGIILLNNQPTLYFSQTDIENKKIVYMQTDINKSLDTFQVNTYITDSSLQGVIINATVLVEPLAKIESLQILPEQSIYKLNLDKEHSNDVSSKINAKFFITFMPKTGSIKKIIRSSENTQHDKERDVNTFSLNELKSGIIYFAFNKTLKEHLLHDFFEYILLVPAAQPAKYKVSIDIIREEEYHAKWKYKIILIIVFLILTIVAVFLIILIKNLKKKKVMTKMLHHRHDEHPPALPIPPEFSKSRTKSFSTTDTEKYSPSIATLKPGMSNIPNCRIINIDKRKNLLDSGSEQQSDYQFDFKKDNINDDQYEYYKNSDDWSISNNEIGDTSMPTCQSPQININPLLRRNQYWV
ncbi:chondroitin sulfate proteoglycan 4 isoform X2 [Condylostylus longicornis]|nr:chondroitin sulfate proteoglycan 4 isoform X2 [Condylostylus longicornis]